MKAITWYGTAAKGGNKDSMANFAIMVANNKLEDYNSEALGYLKTCINDDWSVCYYALTLYVDQFVTEDDYKKK